MKKISIYITSINVLLLSGILLSCNNIVETQEENYPIVVEAIIDPQFTAASRGVRLTARNLSSFGMWGFYNGAARARDVVYTKTSSTWRNNRPVTWAAGAMDFYGFSPSFSISSVATSTTMMQNPKNVEYESPADVDSQVDIMYSSKYGLKRTDNNGKIIFSFKPAMHYISFNGKNTIGTDYKVFVKEIILHNIVSNGKFVYNATTANLGSWTLATGSDAKYINMRKVFSTPVELTSTNIQMLAGEYFIIIPQSCTMWNTSATNPIPITTADANHNYYIETVAQIIKVEGTNEIYLLGNPDNSDSAHPQYESVYFPVTAKNYRINTASVIPINFNGGYNKDGLPYLENNDRGGDVEIEVAEWMEFDFEIEEWIPIYEDLEF